LTASGLEMPIGNLDPYSGLRDYVPFSLGPWSDIGPVNFFRDFLTLEQAVAAFQNVRAIIIRVGLYELRDSRARPYVFDVPAIRSRTATVEIDYGPLRPPERFFVATNLDPGRPGVTVERALREILQVPFQCGADTG